MEDGVGVAEEKETKRNAEEEFHDGTIDVSEFYLFSLPPISHFSPRSLCAF
jgi:hypothetical protein